MPHHELGVSFGQCVSHKPDGLQMLNHSMKEFWLQNRNRRKNKIKKTCHPVIKLSDGVKSYLFLSLRGVVWMGQQNINITTRCSTWKL